MRLTTLARKIQITPTKLIEFLTKQDIKIDNGVNTKLDEEAIRVAMEKFMPDAVEEPVVVEIETPSEVVKEMLGAIDAVSEPVTVNEDEVTKAPEALVFETEIKQDTISAEQSAPKMSDIKPSLELRAGTIEDLEMGHSEDIELIRVKKVKLEGIKVVGKIELPEKPRKTEAKADGVEGEDQAVVTPEVKKPVHPKDKRKFNKQKNYKGGKNRKPLSYEEKLKIEEREKRRLQKQKAREEKARKKKYYLENIQSKTAGQVKKKKKKQPEENIQKSRKATAYKNPFRRLWAWLNGEYDRY